MSNIEYAKKTAMNIIDSSVYVLFLAVLAVGNAIGCPIQLYTKPLGDQHLMALYNNLNNPFEKGLSDKKGPINWLFTIC